MGAVYFRRSHARRAPETRRTPAKLPRVRGGNRRVAEEPQKTRRLDLAGSPRPLPGTGRAVVEMGPGRRAGVGRGVWSWPLLDASSRRLENGAGRTGNVASGIARVGNAETSERGPAVGPGRDAPTNHQRISNAVEPGPG